MIKVTDIHKRFGDLEVLKGVSLDVAEGEVVSIVGASGAGKTTLLQIVGTLSRPDAGRVEIDGQDAFSLGDKALSRFRNERIGFVFQFHHLLPEFTAFENVCIPGFIGRRPRAEVERRAAELLEMMNLTPRRGHKPGQLSGGEQQRHRACTDQFTCRTAGRRTFGQPRFAQPRRDTPPFLRAARPAGADRRDRHPRRASGGDGRPEDHHVGRPDSVIRRFMDDELKELLERLHDKYNRPEFIEDDPISVPHRYTDRADREIAGFLAATIAWGNRRAIVTSGHRMMRCMDDAPADFVRNASDRELATLKTYVHRTFNGRDLRDFVLALRRMDRRFGGLGVFFEERYAAVQSIPAVLSEFRREFFSCDHAPRCEKHLSSIDRGAACKRLCMFLRWMVRRDERGVDFGLWTRIPMSALYIPLDLHTGDMARALGLLSRRQNDWRAVEEVTAALRGFDPADPVRYDFSLFGAGIDGYLKEC